MKKDSIIRNLAYIIVGLCSVVAYTMLIIDLFGLVITNKFVLFTLIMWIVLLITERDK